MISIIMPVKNTEKYLAACLESIISQSYTDWELIAVDDHSTDKSRTILEDFTSKDSRITVLKNGGQGITPALITGYQKATGQYITRMDSDDLMPPDKLSLLYNQWQSKGKGYVVTGRVEYFSDQPLGEGYKKYADWLNALTKAKNNFSEIYKECPIASPNWLMERSDFEAAGGFDTEMYPEDYCLVFKWKERGYKINAINQVTHLWRDYPSRTSRTDENYSDNTFTKLKVKYFLTIDHDPSKSLVLWGAGNKGKAVAKELLTNGIPFRWICDNKKKIGLDIYGIKMEDVSSLEDLKEPQLIIAVSQKDAQIEITKQLRNLQIDESFFFC